MQGDVLALYLFIICEDYVLSMSTNLIKENGFTIRKRQEQDNIQLKITWMLTT